MLLWRPILWNRFGGVFREVIVEIHAGVGGEDAQLFVHDLAAMYSRHAINGGLKGEVLFSAAGHVILKFTGRYAGQWFKKEAGKHCIQRVPPTEKRGRVQTSMVAVAVLPLPPTGRCEVPMSELEISTTKGSGPGGQHKNVTESAVRIVHKPTKISVVIDGRDQHSNKREALRIIFARVQEAKSRVETAEYGKKRKEQMKGGGRSDKTRTYNLSDSRVIDHQTGRKTKDVKGVLKGDLSFVYGVLNK